MAKKLKQNQIIVMIVVILAIFFVAKNANFLNAVTGFETLSRSISTTKMLPGQSFKINYTINDANFSESWILKITESISGAACKFSETNSNYYDKTFDQSSGSLIQSDVVAPVEAGECIFQGTYRFGNGESVVMPALKIKICTPSCTRPADLCLEASAVPDGGCGGYCTGFWTTNKVTLADANCDGTITRTELAIGLDYYANGQLPRAELAKAIQSWSDA